MTLSKTLANSKWPYFLWERYQLDTMPAAEVSKDFLKKMTHFLALYACYFVGMSLRVCAHVRINVCACGRATVSMSVRM